MRLLVTGGAGFIGGAIVEAALERGWAVRVLDSLRSDVHGASDSHGSETGAVDSTTAPFRDSRVEFQLGDVRDAAAVTRALDGIDVVCHQAAKVGLGVNFSDAPDYVSSNELGTAVLLATMAQRGIRRLVIASSMVVYGEGSYRSATGVTRPAPRRVSDLDARRFDPLDDDGNPLTPELISEDALLDPRNVYAVTKLAQEHLAAAWARATGGTVVALRYHNVYGPRMPQNTPYAGVASLFRSSLARGEAPRVFEDGAQRRDFVHVSDIASANLAALEATADASHDTGGAKVTGGFTATAGVTVVTPPFRAFNVGSGTVHTIGEMAAQLSKHANGLAPIITGEYRLGDVRHITASSERIKRELGWVPQISFEAGMKEFATAPLRAAVVTPT
ncbi:MAG: NAD-dependent epimerase/dehydratase family protein [Microbacteriaceae bacterium]|nr:NAD-dependent epimerase/dehydratase family protein [Microbacteriaceae bacterium]